MGEIRERDAAVGFGQRFQQVEAARQALHLARMAPLRRLRTGAGGVVNRCGIGALVASDMGDGPTQLSGACAA